MAERSNAYGKAICELLGIPANLVQSMRINIDAREALTVDVTFVPKKLSAGWYEAISKLKDDEQLILNFNWSRPIFELTNMESTSTELEG